MDWTAIWVSIKLALVTTLLLALIGVPLAHWLAFTRWRWKFLAEAVIALPLVLPPTVLGFYLLVGLGPKSALGGALESLAGWRLPFTFAGLVVASVLYSLPFAVQRCASAFAAVDRRLIEVSWTLGASRTRTFLKLILPLSMPGVVAGLVLTFAHTIGEFGVVLMVGGNIQGITRTASVSIYDDVQALDYASAGRTSAVLLVMSCVALSMTYALRRRAWSV
jgi:molybdate transport system permease protein